MCSLCNFRLARSRLYPLARVAAEECWRFLFGLFGVAMRAAPAVSYRAVAQASSIEAAQEGYPACVRSQISGWRDRVFIPWRGWQPRMRRFLFGRSGGVAGGAGGELPGRLAPAAARDLSGSLVRLELCRDAL